MNRHADSQTSHALQKVPNGHASQAVCLRHCQMLQLVSVCVALENLPHMTNVAVRTALQNWCWIAFSSELQSVMWSG